MLIAALILSGLSVVIAIGGVWLAIKMGDGPPPLRGPGYPDRSA